MDVFRYYNDDGHGRIHESRGGQRSREDRDLRRYPALRRRGEPIPVVPVHPAPTVHLRLRLFVLRAILHHSRARRALVQHTRVGFLQSHGLREVSLTRRPEWPFGALNTLHVPQNQSNTQKKKIILIYIESSKS